MAIHSTTTTGDAMRQELQQVDWSQFETAYGVATDVPGQLVRLFSPNHDDAMAASHELWCGLCHQHAYVSSAALPALPFLIRALDALDAKLAVEVLDILCGFAVCTAGDSLPDWGRRLRQSLLVESRRFEALTHHQDEDVSDWALRLCRELSITHI
jgi:hypothetical protein